MIHSAQTAIDFRDGNQVELFKPYYAAAIARQLLELNKRNKNHVSCAAYMVLLFWSLSHLISLTDVCVRVF